MNANSFNGYPIIALLNLEYSLLIVLKCYWEATIEGILQKYLNMCSSNLLIYKQYSCICVQNLWKITWRSSTLVKLQILNVQLSWKIELLCRYYLIDFSRVAEALFCRTPPSDCLCALLEKKRMKEMKGCVFIVPSLTFFFVALQGSVGELRTN